MRRSDHQRRAAEGIRKLDPHAPSADAGMRDHAQRLVVEASYRNRGNSHGGVAGAGVCAAAEGGAGGRGAGNGRGCCGDVAQVLTQCSGDCAKTWPSITRATISSLMSNYFSASHRQSCESSFQKAARLVDLFLADDVRPSLVNPQLNVRAQFSKQAGGFVRWISGIQSSTSLPVSNIRKPARDRGAVAFQSEPGKPIKRTGKYDERAHLAGMAQGIFERQSRRLARSRR